METRGTWTMTYISVTWDDGNLIFETEDGKKDIVYGKFKIIRLAPKHSMNSAYKILRMHPTDYQDLYLDENKSYYNDWWDDFIDKVFKLAQIKTRKWKLEALGL